VTIDFERPCEERMCKLLLRLSPSGWNFRNGKQSHGQKTYEMLLSRALVVWQWHGGQRAYMLTARGVRLREVLVSFGMTEGDAA
jgi:hypothetical protein